VQLPYGAEDPSRPGQTASPLYHVPPVSPATRARRQFGQLGLGVLANMESLARTDR
jgi:hypothetical protein